MKGYRGFSMTSKDITQISVIAAILTILAALKIPSIIPGLDFQLSAPAALLILAFFGIKKYFLGGLLSSLLLLVFGVFNPINVIISIIFRSYSYCSCLFIENKCTIISFSKCIRQFGI